VSQIANVELQASMLTGNQSSSSSVVSVTEGYERWAPTYDGDPNPLLAREERHLLPLVDALRGKRMLDLACGTGRWLEKLMASGTASGVGVDCSAAMLRVARNKCSIATRLAQSACENLPFGNAAFDLLTCSFALGHIQDLQKVAQEMARVARRRADVFISDLHPEAHSRGWRVGFRDGDATAQIEMLPRPSEQTIQIFCGTGFDCVRCDSLWLGEPERAIFVRAERAHAFAEACQVPAILMCHLRRR
jgi:SAM-dependent methyltransferase